MGKTRLGKAILTVTAAGALSLAAAPAAAANSDNCIIHRDLVTCACLAVGGVWVKVTGESWACTS
jgi:hypothetical protein